METPDYERIRFISGARNSFKVQWNLSRKQGQIHRMIPEILEEMKTFEWWGVRGRNVLVQTSSGRFLFVVKGDGRVKISFVCDRNFSGRFNGRSYMFTVKKEQLREVREALLRQMDRQQEFDALFGEVPVHSGV